MMGLTPRQSECLEFLRACQKAGEIMPTYRQIAAHLGITKSNVHRLVHALADRGYVRFLPNHRQTVMVLEPKLRGDTEGLLAQLALRKRTTRDQLVQQAITEFLDRELRA